MADESLHLLQQQRLQQSLSPQQIRFGRLLEMNGPELEEEVRRELDANPALEVADSKTADASAGGDEDDFNESAEQLQMADYGSEDDIPSYRLTANNYSPDDDRPDQQIADAHESLLDSLTAQLGELSLPTLDSRIAHYIIGNLDDNGYLTRDIADMADDMAINMGADVQPADVRRVLRIVRTLEPAGIGAVDLRDCLLLQLRSSGRDDDSTRLATEIVRDYFDLFSKMHFEQLERELNVEREELTQAIDVIRALNPKPGASVGSSGEVAIVPDFSVTVDNDGSPRITLLSTTPDLTIAPSFTIDDEGTQQAFIKRSRDDASEFISLLSQRRHTLTRIMAAIVKLQRDFFITDDPSQLRPMILKDIAAITGDDLSVISRATAGKYVLTDGGIYPLKFFFNEGIAAKAEGAEEISQHRVQEALRDIIDDEDKRKPLSDEALTEALAQRGYEIARRTVTKYRERLGIPVARLRKSR